jgi:hypothetical protein
VTFAQQPKRKRPGIFWVDVRILTLGAVPLLPM